MLLCFLILFGQGSSGVDPVFNRYVIKHQAPPSFEATYRASYNGGPMVPIRFAVKGNDHMVFEAPSPRWNYRIAMSPQLTREQSRHDEWYRDIPARGRPFLPAKPLSWEFELCPGWYSIKDLRKLAPANAVWKLKAKSSDAAPGQDTLTTQFSTMGATVNLTLTVDHDGVVRLYEQKVASPMGNESHRWELQKLTVKTFRDQDFKIEVPLGFSLFSSTLPDPAVEIGGKWPMKGWSSGTGSANLAQLTSGKLALFAILGTDGPSIRAANALKQLSATLPVITISADKSPQGRTLYDATGRNLAAISPPALPFMALVAPDGTIQNLWLGFDWQHPEALEAAVKAALKAP